MKDDSYYEELAEFYKNEIDENDPYYGFSGEITGFDGAVDVVFTNGKRRSFLSGSGLTSKEWRRRCKLQI